MSAAERIVELIKAGEAREKAAAAATNPRLTLEGVSIVKDFFRSDVDPNTALSQVSSLAISDLYYLPPGTIPPMVMPFDPTAVKPLCLLAISSDSLDETTVYDVAYFSIRNLLSGTPGVVAPAVYGGRLRRILVFVDREKLMARGLSPIYVMNAVRAYNVFIPSGDAKIGDYDYQLVSNAMVPEVSGLNDIVVKYDEGRAVYVRDVGEAEDSYAIQTNAVNINGRRAVYIPIYRQPGANSIEIVDGIKGAIADIQNQVPHGKQLKMEVIVDQSVYIRKSITSLELEGLMGALLAAVMILLFLANARFTAIIAVSLPLSILAAVICLYFTRQTINSVTLGGLALAVGMLMDNGIVVLENTARHLKLGKSPAAAALDAAGEVAMPVFMATLTICVIFTPVIFLSGIGKFLFTPLAMAVIFALSASYFLSLTLLPVACAYFLGSESHSESRKSGLLLRLNERALTLIQDSYRKALRFSLHHRPGTITVILLIIGASLLLYPFLGRELFPQIDSGQFMILMRAPSGTRLEKTEEYARRTEEVVRQIIPESELQMVVSNTGILYDWPAAYTPNSGLHDSFILVQLRDHRSRTSQEYAQMLRQRLREAIPEVQYAFDTGGIISSALNFGLPSPVNVQVEGPAIDTSYAIARTVIEKVKMVQGVVDARIQQNMDYPRIRLDVDRTRAASLGLTQEEVVKNVVASLNSSTTFLPSFWIDEKTGNHYFVGVTYREKDIASRETIADIPITGAHQRHPVPLRNLASIGTAQGVVEVNHVNIRRVIDVYANVWGRDIGSVSSQIQRIVSRMRCPPGYKVVLRGESQSMLQSFNSLAWGLALAIILVYLVLVIQFRSFIDPVIIICTIPLGLSGVLFILFLTHTTLNIQSFMGVIMVVGLAVSYSVLIVDFANRLIKEGKAVEEAIIDASTTRLRPILMTSLAAILGLVPMALHAEDANMSLARAVIGGLAASTILKLFLVPALYTYLKRAPSMISGGSKNGG